MSRKWICLLLCLLLLTGAAACKKKAVKVDLTNSDFSQVKANGNPKGWDILSYTGNYSSYAKDNTAVLIAPAEDDLRFLQTVAIQGGTKYVFSADIRTTDVVGGHGACLSVDNYSIDGSYISSQTVLSGSTDWTHIELAFETAPLQETVVLALRLGYYGGACRGTAEFRNIAFEKSSTAGVTFQPLVPQDGGVVGDEQGKTTEDYVAYFSVILIAFTFVAVIMVFGIYRARKRIIAAAGDNPIVYTAALAVIILIGLIVRLILCATYKGHSTDLNCWISWGGTMAESGLSGFYNATSFCDYPPAYMIVLGVLSRIGSLLKLSSETTAGRFLYMLPAFLADIGIALLAVKLCKKINLPKGFALFVAGLVVLNPALAFLSGAWSQIDSILTFFLLLSFACLTDNKRLLAGLFYGIAIMFKWQALMFGPVLAMAFLFSIRNWKDILKTVAAVIIALVTILCISLPLRPEGEPFYYVVTRFMESTKGYNYASVEAYNFITLIGGNWASADASVVSDFALTFKQFGTLFIVLSVRLSAGMFVVLHYGQVQNKRSLFEKKGEIYAISAFSMYAIFTFGHYMHERYVIPVIAFILFAYIFLRDRRLLLSAILLTLAAFLNEMTAMYVVSEGAINVIRGGREQNEIIRFCSALEVASFAYYCKVLYNLIFGKEESIHEKDC